MALPPKKPPPCQFAYKKVIFSFPVHKRSHLDTSSSDSDSDSPGTPLPANSNKPPLKQPRPENFNTDPQTLPDLPTAPQPKQDNPSSSGVTRTSSDGEIAPPAPTYERTLAFMNSNKFALALSGDADGRVSFGKNINRKTTSTIAASASYVSMARLPRGLFGRTDDQDCNINSATNLDTPTLLTTPHDFGWAKIDGGYYNVFSKPFSDDPYRL
ncbi:hypothetical protein DFQ28_009078 [Apophysomyces sp. BC1034]|nr:hypothetical protein DFQ30_009056 [Apophysomyces sp. BC1015]KAG0180820.1 hypothetical protein DFQ29_010083 [Apophysomyces sp. BC1021]KAG0192467.1 hypothetical protein DFQ28_009078 [Apophysomyces sp. BC1034]